MSSVSPPPSNVPSMTTGTTASSSTATDNTALQNTTSADAQSKLAEAIDDFLGDLEKKFKGISDEILTRLDDMAERCDRLEQEMLLKETAAEGSGMEKVDYGR